MPYMNVDDKLHSHPKRWRAGLSAMGLWVVCGSWQAEYLTDGFIPAAVVQSQGGAKAKSLASTLVAAGLWHHDEDRDGYQMHDHCDHNLTAAEWEQKKAAAAERKRRQRAKEATSDAA